MGFLVSETGFKPGSESSDCRCTTTLLDAERWPASLAGGLGPSSRLQ